MSNFESGRGAELGLRTGATYMDSGLKEVGKLSQRDEVSDMGWQQQVINQASAGVHGPRDKVKKRRSSSRRPVGAVPDRAQGTQREDSSQPTHKHCSRI